MKKLLSLLLLGGTTISNIMFQNKILLMESIMIFMMVKLKLILEFNENGGRFYRLKLVL